MKKLITVALLFIGFVLLADPTTNAPAVKLAWNQSVQPQVNAYGLYWGPAPRTYTNGIVLSGITNTSANITLVRGGTYYFAATCIATNGLESAYSSEVTYATVPAPNAPTAVTITVLVQ